MSEQKQKGLVPKLRFPEFRDGEAWRENKVRDICKKSFSGGTPNTTSKQYYSGTIPFIRSAEIDKDETELFLTNEGLTNSSAKLVKKGDVLVALYGANSGDVALGKINGAINQAVLCLRSKDSNTFLYQYLSYKKREIISKYLQGGQGNLSGDIIKSIELLLPKSKEQQKIADCLSSIDESISTQTEKLNALKNHKKALMQQLFPAEGETTPQLRFPEFRDSEAWQIKLLSKVCEINPSTENLPEKFIYIDLESVESGKLIKKKTISLDSAPSRAQRLLKSGDIIFQTVRPYQKNNYFFRTDDNYEYVASTGYAQLKANESKMYLYQYLYNDKFVNRVLAKCSGSNYPAINSTDLSQVQVEIPKDPKEQQKIADCLSSIDELITAQTEKIDRLQTHKKGLMQQLFPTADEMSA